MKNVFNILILTLLFASCRKETNSKVEVVTSEFNLTTDITDFKNQMTAFDTLKIWVNHSVCTYQGAERIEITKETDLIKIRSQFKEETIEQNSEWKFVYEKKIPISDTLWKMEEFFERNSHRQISEKKEYGTLQVSHNGEKIHYFTNRLIDLNRFIADYSNTMKKLYPENKNNIYGVEEVVEIENIKDE